MVDTPTPAEILIKTLALTPGELQSPGELHEALSSKVAPELSAAVVAFFTCRKFLDGALTHYRAEGAKQEVEFRLAALEAELLALGSLIEELLSGGSIHQVDGLKSGISALSAFLETVPTLPAQYSVGAEELLIAAALAQSTHGEEAGKTAEKLGLLG